MAVGQDNSSYPQSGNFHIHIIIVEIEFLITGTHHPYLIGYKRLS